MPILDEYNKQLQQKNYAHDPEQLNVVEHLAQLQSELSNHFQLQNSIFYKMRKRLGLQTPDVSGFYIWGDVGRGKTWLMDMFFESLGRSDMDSDSDSEDNRNSKMITERKIRLHFHHFMQTIHDQLSLLNEQKNPLKLIAKAFARRYQVLCLDEFHVSDITDAMLLYGLLQTLFEEGVVLIATSNQAPDELYKNGLQRERFLPAIQLIKKHTHTLRLNGEVDHRLRLLDKADTWHLITENSDATLEARFLELSACSVQRQHKIHINYRVINTIMLTEGIIWLDFQVICGNQRGAADYIEIARQFHSVFISDIPQMNDGQNDKAKRFVNMIDEFYDRNINLLCSAASKPEELYSGKQLAFEFQRTLSRLLEMRSHEYMQRQHKIS